MGRSSGVFTRHYNQEFWINQSISTNSKYILTSEKPCEYQPGLIPFYPMPFKEDLNLFAKYKELMDAEKNVIFCGRLGSYKYMNMDVVIKDVMDKLKAKELI